MSVFDCYYPPDQHNLWSTARIAVDTNVLLHLHRYPPEQRLKLYRILAGLKDRLYIPFHVAVEYHLNRDARILEQKEALEEVQNILEKWESDIKKSLKKLSVDKNHSVVYDASALRVRVGEFIKNEKSQVLAAIEEFGTGLEPSREQVKALILGHLGPHYEQGKINEYVADGEERYKARRPPGYRDQEEKKETTAYSPVCKGLVYKRKFGDLLIWKELLDLNESFIFVTDDVKEDWFQFDGVGKYSPRPELVEEALLKVPSFNLATVSELLDYSTELLDEAITERDKQVGVLFRRVVRPSSAASLFERHARQSEKIRDGFMRALKDLGYDSFEDASKAVEATRKREEDVLRDVVSKTLKNLESENRDDSLEVDVAYFQPTDGDELGY